MNAKIAIGALAAIGVVAAALGPNFPKYPGVLCGSLLFLASLLPGQWLCPNTKAILSPRNWGLAVFAVPTVIIPVMIAWIPLTRGVLPYVPPDDAINGAMLLSGVALISFALGLGRVTEKTERSGGASSADLSFSWSLGFVALGLVGIALTFRSVPAILNYYRAPAANPTGGSAQPAINLLSIVLRPFVIVGVVALWSGTVLLNRHRRRWALVATLGAAVCIIATGLTYNFNRAAVAVPLVALLSSYALWVRKVRALALGGIAVISGAGLLLIQAYRAGGTAVDAGLTDSSVIRPIVIRSAIMNEVQIYGSGPQFSAFLIRASELSLPYRSETLIGSLLYPIPRLGKSFRKASGPAIYNRLIYGSTAVLDQLIPFPGELYVNLGLPGVIVVFWLLGWSVTRLDVAYFRARTPLEAYVAFFTAVWLLYLILGSLSAVAQIFVYFFWPIYVYLAVRGLARRRTSGRLNSVNTG